MVELKGLKTPSGNCSFWRSISFFIVTTCWSRLEVALNSGTLLKVEMALSRLSAPRVSLKSEFCSLTVVSVVLGILELIISNFFSSLGYSRSTSKSSSAGDEARLFCRPREVVRPVTFMDWYIC